MKIKLNAETTAFIGKTLFTITGQNGKFLPELKPGKPLLLLFCPKQTRKIRRDAFVPPVRMIGSLPK